MRSRAKLTTSTLLAVATPMHMIAPVSAGTLTGVCDRNSIHTIPASAAGRAVMMMNGSSQDWKLTTISRYTSTIAAASPSSSPANESVMVFTCPRTATCELRGSEAEVASLDGSEDVDHRRGVVVAHHGRRDAAVKARKVGEQLRGPAPGGPGGGGAAGDRRRGEVPEGSEPELRRLGCDGVLGAALRVDPEGERGLRAAGERDQQVGGDIGLREPEERRLAAVDLDVQLGVIEGLLDAQIDDPGDAVQPGEERLRMGAVGLDVEA